MGTCCSQTHLVHHPRHRSEISKELRQDSKIDKRKFKILILGPKRSGKSTILNQLKYLHGNGFNDAERAQSRLDIVSYIITSFKTIIECVEEFEKYKQFALHRFTLNDEAKLSAEYMKNVDTNHNILDDIVANHIHLLSQQTPIQRIIANADKYYIDISIRYFLKHFDRIKNINYIPSDQDIIQLRIKTEAFHEENIVMNGHEFSVCDINYKPDICNANKYMHCFENVTAIIFVASLCCFDEPIFEDNKTYQQKMEWKQSMEIMKSVIGSDILNIVLEFVGYHTNAMRETFELFDSLCNNIWFKHIAIFLFLSKSDLFRDKLSEYQKISNCNEINPFSQVFMDYANEIEYYQCSDYIRRKFLALNANESRNIYPHCVNGTDITLMTKIFHDAQHTIISTSLQQAGLI